MESNRRLPACIIVLAAMGLGSASAAEGAQAQLAIPTRAVTAAPGSQCQPLALPPPLIQKGEIVQGNL